MDLGEQVASGSAVRAKLDDATAAKNQQALQTVLQKLVEDGVVPGIGAIVSVNGKRISAYAGYAVLEDKIPMSEHSRFEISCLMKFYVSLVALSLAEEGKLDLDAPIGDYLPELRENAPDKANSILVKHLMSHTSGYRGLNIMDAAVKWGMTWPKFVDFFGRTEQLFKPGTVFSYEHSEHVILGEILKWVTGRTATELVAARVFEPLSLVVGTTQSDRAEVGRLVVGYAPRGQPRTFTRIRDGAFPGFWAASLPSVTLSSSHIAASGRDLSDASGGPSFVCATSWCLTQMKKLGVPLQRALCTQNREHLPDSFGLCCAQYAHGILGHNGSMGGQTCAFRFAPGGGATIFVGMNVWLPHVRDAVTVWLMKSLVGPGAPLDKGPQHSAGTLEQFCEGIPSVEFAGTYLGGPNGELDVTIEGGKIVGSTRSPNGRMLVFSACERNGTLELETSLPVPIAVFTDQDDGTACIRVGLHTYKRSS